MIYHVVKTDSGWWVMKENDERFLTQNGQWTTWINQRNYFNSRRYAISILKSTEYYMNDKTPNIST